MSTIASWSYVEGPVTFWPYSSDEYGQPVYGAPYKIDRTDYELGGEVSRDPDGTEFVPRISVYFELDDVASPGLVPGRDWYMKLGDHTAEATPPKDAERVRMVTKWPMEKFGAGELPDFKVTA